jgi:hypothetical protein
MAGFTVRIAANGRQALEALSDARRPSSVPTCACPRWIGWSSAAARSGIPASPRSDPRRGRSARAGLQLRRPELTPEAVSGTAQTRAVDGPSALCWSVAGWISWLVRKEGLEPSRCYPQVPETCASTSSATFAGNERIAAKSEAVKESAAGGLMGGGPGVEEPAFVNKPRALRRSRRLRA